MAVQRRRAAGRAAAEDGVVVDAPGLTGWAAPAGRPPAGRLFVAPRAAPDRLDAVLDALAPREVTLLGDPGAPGCRELLDRRPELAGPEGSTAMLRPTLAGLPGASLPPGLRAVAVLDAPGAAPSRADVAAAVRAADPGVQATFPAAEFTAHVRRLPVAVLLAAVDDAGRVRATAGASCVDGDATVVLVSTDPAWRGRGTATAMTALALRAAADHGAVRACLDASAAGRGTYLRLGFTAVGSLRSWRRAVR